MSPGALEDDEYSDDAYAPGDDAQKQELNEETAATTAQASFQARNAVREDPPSPLLSLRRLR